MNDWMLMLASAAAAALIAYSELSPTNVELAPAGASTATVPDVAVPVRDPKAAAENGAIGQTFGAMGQAVSPGGR